MNSPSFTDTPGRGRPQGEVRQALLRAYEQGPTHVRDAAQRACVGLAVARYTASRMVSAGELVVLQATRPAVLSLPGSSAAVSAGCGAAVSMQGALDALAGVWGSAVMR